MNHDRLSIPGPPSCRPQNGFEKKRNRPLHTPTSRQPTCRPLLFTTSFPGTESANINMLPQTDTLTVRSCLAARRGRNNHGRTKKTTERLHEWPPRSPTPACLIDRSHPNYGLLPKHPFVNDINTMPKLDARQAFDRAGNARA